MAMEISQSEKCAKYIKSEKCQIQSHMLYSGMYRSKMQHALPTSLGLGEAGGEDPPPVVTEVPVVVTEATERVLRMEGCREAMPPSGVSPLLIVAEQRKKVIVRTLATTGAADQLSWKWCMDTAIVY